jgi:hypothetical protein
MILFAGNTGIMGAPYEFILQKTIPEYIHILGGLSLRHLGENLIHWHAIQDLIKKVLYRNLEDK